MKTKLAPWVTTVVLVIAFGGCSTTTHREGGDGGTGGSNPEGGSSGSGTGGDAGSGGGLGSNGVGGSGGGSGGAGPGGAGPGGSGGSGGNLGSNGVGGDGGAGGVPPECPADPNFVTHGDGWVGCDPARSDDNPFGFQGAFYPYGDGYSCAPPPSSPCGADGCCISGATFEDPTFTMWGCGIGFELNATGGIPSTKYPYDGPVSCFEFTLTGDTGGSSVRIAFTHAEIMDGLQPPIVELGPIAGSFSSSVCFGDAACPIWAEPGTCSVGRQYDLQVQIVGGIIAAPYQLCLTRLVPLP